MDDRIAMSHNCMGNLREYASRSVNKWTRCYVWIPLESGCGREWKVGGSGVHPANSY